MLVVLVELHKNLLGSSGWKFNQKTFGRFHIVRGNEKMSVVRRNLNNVITLA